MKYLVTHESGGVITVTLSRPERHNAFHPGMIGELTELFLELDHRSDLVAIVLKGSGKSFSAGGDLEWMRSMIDYSFEENLIDARRLFDMYRAIALCGTPVLGLVHGNVMGGGLGLVAVCDVVAAEENTQFCFSEAKIGIAPAVISPWVLRKVPQSFVRDVMLTARLFGADEAKKMGLIHFVGNASTADDFIAATIGNLQQCARGAVREAKNLLNHIAEDPWPQLRERAAHVIANRRVSDEGQEGLKAFLEKREPKWRSRKR